MRLRSAFLLQQSPARIVAGARHGRTLFLISALFSSFGIREGRCGNQVHSVGTLISGDETLANASVHCAVRGAGLVRKAREVGLNEILLEVLARVPGHDLSAQIRRN